MVARAAVDPLLPDVTLGDRAVHVDPRRLTRPLWMRVVANVVDVPALGLRAAAGDGGVAAPGAGEGEAVAHGADAGAAHVGDGLLQVLHLLLAAVRTQQNLVP